MAEEAMVPAAAEVAALRFAAEVAEAATAKGRRNETKLARAKRRRVSEAEGKRCRAQPDACLCARLGGGERAWTARARPPRGRARRAVGINSGLLREREIVPTPYLLILGGMSSGIQAIWPPRVAVLFQFGRALLRNQRALSGKPMFWQPYRCTTPGCWPRGIAGVMDLLSAGGTT